MFPVCPLNVSVPLLLPEHTVVVPLTAPPTDTGFTVIVAEAELEILHTPLCTTTLYKVVCVRFVYDWEVVVLVIVVHVVPSFTEDSHLTTFPVCPLKVSVPLLFPEHTAVVPLTEPPTETGFTVMVAEDELEMLQTPLCTTALYKVVCVRFVYD
jgi:hypothetical protein